LWWGKNGTWDDNASGTGVPADGTNPTYTDSGISDGGFIFFGVASGSGAIMLILVMLHMQYQVVTQMLMVMVTLSMLYHQDTILYVLKI
jgi:hypothetical protein